MKTDWGLQLLQSTGTDIAFSASNVTVLIIIILVLLLLTAIAAGGETAYFSLKAKDINYLKTKDDATARKAIRLLDQPKILLASLLVATSTINIAIIIASSILIEQLLPASLLTIYKLLIQIGAITTLLILFGEILPKLYATQNNIRMALFAAPVLHGINWLFKPISRTLVTSTKYFEEKLGSRPGGNMSAEDFEQAIEATVGHTATREEVDIFKGILKFSNITARQIMRTRHDVNGLEYSLTFPEVQRITIDAGHSRLPVYKDNLDNIVGVIHTKDFLLHGEDDGFDWHSLIHNAYFVHEGKLIEDLLREFQKKRIHFAVVVDEFGGTSGILTLEDIMEEIIGDIKDEFDEDDPMFRKIDDRNYIIEGKTLINDVCRMIGAPYDAFDQVRGESDSLGGLILELSGKFPAINEIVSYEQYDFTVLEVEKMRIQRVKLTINDTADNTAE